MSRSRSFTLAVAGALGAVVGLYLYVETVKTSSLWVRDGLAGAWIGGALGFFLNAAEPHRDRAWLKMSRDASLGALFGALGGAIGLLVGEAVLGGFQGGLLGRSLSWAILGLGVGVSQAAAERSAQRLRLGLIGGGLGGFFGGFVFEALREALGPARYPLSQGLGAAILGAGLGLALALVERALRQTWLEVRNGRQEGRVFLLTKASSRVGLDEHADIGLFGDLGVARAHADIAREGNAYRIRPLDNRKRTAVNGAPIDGPKTLRDGDTLELGATRLSFHDKATRSSKSS